MLGVPMASGETNIATDDAIRAAGELIDSRYRITGHLGRGGMGHVYRAEHVKIRRPVALKLLRSEFRNLPGFQERFEREAFASGKLRHPNCVAVTDCGTLDDGSSFLVMELLEGRSLVDVLETERRVSVTRALRIARHALRGLGHAHAADVIHRDVKPENIFLVRHGDDHEFAKILDFGIAKLIGDSAGKDLTQVGIALGSPRYMSPEQATGRPLDPRSDLYSLTTVLFELIAGRNPFYADDPMEAVRMHVKKPPPTFADVDPMLSVPPAVEALVLRGLSKDADGRPQTADEYITAIDAILAAPIARSPVPVPARVPAPAVQPVPVPVPAPVHVHAPRPADTIPVPARPRAPSRDHRRWYVIGGILAILVIAIAIGASDSANPDAASGGDDDGEITMDPEVLGAGVPAEALANIPALAGVQSDIRAGNLDAAHRALKKLRSQHRQDPHVHYLLGHVYMQKRWWSDGFDAYRDAVAGHPAYRDDRVLIRNAIRNLSSPSQAYRGERFLSNEIGAPAIPLLEDAAEHAQSKRVRENAARLLDKMRQ
jgi:serine/threonine-protein kinase